MKNLELLELEALRYRLTHSAEDTEFVSCLMSEIRRLTNLVESTKDAAIRNQEIIVKKNEEIQKLKRALDNRDKAILDKDYTIKAMESSLRSQGARIEQLEAGTTGKVPPEAVIRAIIAERDKYLNALTELEGALQARADHDTEMSIRIHKLLSED